MEDYHYIPPHELAPNRTDELVDDYDLMYEVDFIAGLEFGQDYQQDLEALTEARNSAETCGCSTCKTAFNILLDQVTQKYFNTSGDKD